MKFRQGPLPKRRQLTSSARACSANRVVAGSNQKCLEQTPGAVRSLFPAAHSSARVRHLSVRTVAAMTLTIGLACVGDACGHTDIVRRASGQAVLAGRVLVCREAEHKCVPAEATIKVLSVHGTTLGKPVAERRVVDGRFRFTMPPGKYFPSASDVMGSSASVHCISGEMVLRAHEQTVDDIRCYARLQSRPD
jgi:hypothetical protein